jgi:hypothetical protein
MPPKVAAHHTVRVDDIRDLGHALMAAADAYPLVFRTETDFYPLVLTYLRGRVPSAEPERRVVNGAIDFWVGGKNPAAIELAVAPQHLRDINHATQRFPGNAGSVRLYATHNASELKKLSAIPQAKAKRRFLLLVDFTDSHNEVSLRRGYEAELPFNKGHNPVHVVYVTRDHARACDFTIGGKKKGPKRSP